MLLKNLNSYCNATATYDSASKKLYVTVDGSQAGSQAWMFSKGDIVFTMIGTATIVANIEELETDNSSNTTTMRLTTSDSLWVGLHSGSRQKSLIKLLAVNQSFVKPYIQINLYFPDVAEKLAEFTLAIASGAGLSFSQALAGLESYSQITANFDAGNPAITCETFVADKVKAKLYIKGGNQLIEIGEGSQQKGTIYNGDATPLQDKFALYSYLDNMREVLREQGGESLIHYNLSLVDNNGLKVVVDGQSVKTVRRTRKDGKIKYVLEFESGQFSMESASGLVAPFTLTIDKSTVKKNDYSDWNGSGITPANKWLTNQEDYKSFNYSKKHGVDGPIFIELYDFPINGVFPTRFASLTVDGTTIYGDLKLSEDNKVMLVKTDNYAELAWAAKIAGFPSSGTGIFTPVALGSAGGKWQTIQLKVDFANLGSALNVYKGLQDIPLLIVAEASALIGGLKVTEAVIAPQVNNVDVLTATANFPADTVKWINADNCLQITVAPNSTDAFSVCKSNGVQEKFSEKYIRDFLDAAVDDIKKEHENDIGQILNLSAREQKIDLEMFLRSTGDGFDDGFLYQFTLNNAEVTQSASGTTYKFYPEAGGVIPQFNLQRYNIIQFVKMAEQNVDVIKSIFVEDIAEDRGYNVWYLKGDTIIEANAKLTIKAGQQLRLNRVDTKNYFTLTNKGTIIIDKGIQLSGSLFVVNVNPANPLPAFTNDGIITCNGGSIWLDNGMTNNGTITNNGDIANFGGTFTNNGSITNNATIVNYIKYGASFAGNPVFGISIINN